MVWTEFTQGELLLMTFAKSPWASEGSADIVFPRREPVGTLSLGGDRSAALGGSNASVYPGRGPLSNRGRPLAGLRRLIAGSALTIGLGVAALSPGWRWPRTIRGSSATRGTPSPTMRSGASSAST